MHINPEFGEGGSALCFTILKEKNQAKNQARISFYIATVISNTVYAFTQRPGI